MKTLASATLILLAMSQAAFAQGLSKSCFNEIMAITEKKADFDLQNFAKDLAVEVAKVKAQLKLPFGKPADSKMTGIGMTVGCLKVFPDNPAQILPLLKDIGIELAKREASKLGAKALEQGANALAQGANAPARPANAPAGPANAPASPPSVPALKACDAVFNPEKKFCYDGGIYDKCDGMEYKPTTHICVGDVANRALCGGTQYNPLAQKCKNDVVLSICGKIEYNPATDGCASDIVYPKCGANTLYNPKIQDCQDGVVFAKCGEALYNPATHGCENGTVNALEKCASASYNPTTHGCWENSKVFPKCGQYLYNPAKYGCKNGTLFALPGKTE